MNNPVINNQTMDSNQTWLEGEMMGCMDKPTTEEWCPQITNRKGFQR